MPNDKRDKIQSKFEVSHRFPNYGNILVHMHARGFRSHHDTLIEFKSPITALCGLNGSGKSTLLQLAAAAYKSPDPDTHHQYSISDFMAISRLDPRPFSRDAQVVYKYWNKERKFNTATITYTDNGWSNYQQRQTRQVFFAGAGHYLPKVEQRDFVAQYANQLAIDEATPVAPEVRAWTSAILSSSYEEIVSHSVRYKDGDRERTGRLVSASHHGVTYSEAHMGYGEGRTLFLVSALESLPPQSLVLIEEPETSLHAAAQLQLGRYLVDVVARKGHQILLTTHSIFLLTPFPLNSLIYLQKVRGKTMARQDLTPLEVRGHLTSGDAKALYVFVEDDVAQSILRGIISRRHPEYLQLIEIHAGGGSEDLRKAMRVLDKTELPVACVLDADMGQNNERNIFKLPGSLPPEKELFASPAVNRHMQERYGLDLEDYCTSLTGVDHHDWCARLARHLNQDRTVLIAAMVDAYVGALPENITSGLVTQLKEASL